MCICQSQSLNLSYLPFPPWCLYVYFLCLCLYFCFANKIISTLKEHFFKLGKLWGNGEIWVPSIQGRAWNTDGELGIACYLKPAGKVARKWENRTDRELGKCQCEIPQFPFFPLTPNGYCWPVCCQILRQYRWLITSFKFWPSSGSAQRCRDVSFKSDSKHYTSVIWLPSFSHGPSAPISTTENGHISDCSHKTGRRVFPKTVGTAASRSLWWCLLVQSHTFNLVSVPLTCITWLQCLGVSWFLTASLVFNLHT